MVPNVISSSKGVIGPLLEKLTELMEDKYTDLVGVSNNIVFLRDELLTMNALLEKLEENDRLGPLAKAWRDQGREMGYDIEDFIDDFLHHAGSGGANAVFFGKVSLFINTLRDHLETAKQIKELKTHIKEINEQLNKRYKFGDCISRYGSVAVDHRLPALYSDEANLVGVDGPREDIIKLLTDADQQLKVLSIVGFGGIGKTTLAKEVYHKIGGEFDVMAFVSVSQRPDIRRLLHNMQSNLGMIGSPTTLDVKVIIDDIRKHLQHNRSLCI